MNFATPSFTMTVAFEEMTGGTRIGRAKGLTVSGASSDTSGRDRERVNRALRGEVEAFEEIIRNHQDRLFNIALPLLGSARKAEEVTRDALLTAYRGLPSFPEEEPLNLWLERILLHHARISWKEAPAWRVRFIVSRGDPVAGDVSSADIGPQSVEFPKDEVPDDYHRIAQLDRESAEVVVLYAYQRRSAAEIASLCGLPEDAVAARIEQVTWVLAEKTDRMGGSAAARWVTTPEELTLSVMEKVREEANRRLLNPRPRKPWRVSWTTVLAGFGLVVIVLGAFAESAPKRWILSGSSLLEPPLGDGSANPESEGRNERERRTAPAPTPRRLSADPPLQFANRGIPPAVTPIPEEETARREAAEQRMITEMAKSGSLDISRIQVLSLNTSDPGRAGLMIRHEAEVLGGSVRPTNTTGRMVIEIPVERAQEFFREIQHVGPIREKSGGRWPSEEGQSAPTRVFEIRLIPPVGP